MQENLNGNQFVYYLEIFLVHFVFIIMSFKGSFLFIRFFCTW